MSCDTTHTLKFKHRKAEKLDGGLESFYALMESESVETLKKAKTTATCSIFRNESRRQDNVLDYVVRVAWDFPGLEIKYESKNEYDQHEEKEIFIEQESRDRLDALIDAAEEDTGSQLRLGMMYLEEESNTLDLNDCSQPEPMDSEQGIKWLQKAAVNGVVRAHEELARLYSGGKHEDKPAGLAHALVAQKMNENEENEKLVKSISSSMNQKDKGKAKKLAEEIAGKIDDSAVVATRSPEEVTDEICGLIERDDLTALKNLMGSKDYQNAIMHEDGYPLTPLDLYRESLEYGSYKSAAWICDLGFFPPVLFDRYSVSDKPQWSVTTSIVVQEEAADKNKALDKFLSHVLENHASVPHCVNWDRKGVEELLEAARSKKMSKTVNILKKHLGGK